MFRLLIADSKRALCDRVRNLLDWQHYGFTTIATANSYPEALDVAVDLRTGSATYGKYFGIELSGDNQKQFYIPQGFAHGFLVLSDYAEFCYKCTDFYHPDDEGGLAYNDPEIGVEWPIPEGMELILSEKDANRPFGELQAFQAERK